VHTVGAHLGGNGKEQPKQQSHPCSCLKAQSASKTHVSPDAVTGEVATQQIHSVGFKAVQALFRIIEPTSGSICVDGLDISQMGLSDLRSRLALVPQVTVMQGGGGWRELWMSSFVTPTICLGSCLPLVPQVA